jgi:hypothetical protein
MGYQALRVELTASGSLRCTFEETIGPFPAGYVVNGRWLDASSIVASVWIPAR